jgi:hypothetical protein
VLADDHDRDRAAVTLREQYAGGRLTLDELTGRVSKVLAARSQRDVRAALAGLPRHGFGGPGDFVAQARSKAGHQLRCERDLRHQHDRAAPLRHRALHGP